MKLSLRSSAASLCGRLPLGSLVMATALRGSKLDHVALGHEHSNQLAFTHNVGPNVLVSCKDLIPDWVRSIILQSEVRISFKPKHRRPAKLSYSYISDEPYHIQPQILSPSIPIGISETTPLILKISLQPFIRLLRDSVELPHVDILSVKGGPTIRRGAPSHLPEFRTPAAASRCGRLWHDTSVGSV